MINGFDGRTPWPITGSLGTHSGNGRISVVKPKNEALCFGTVAPQSCSMYSSLYLYCILMAYESVSIKTR
jgi:hypothetical protein